MKELRIRVIEKNGKCPHNIGDEWSTPYALMKPRGLCSDAHYVLVPYLGMAAGGAPSWEEDKKWRIHCPSKSGIIFEIKPLEKNHKWPTDFSWVEESEYDTKRTERRK
ncbi:MAG: TIGR04076 family protein [Candidatus Hodarchaeota archaeon]